MIKNARLNYRNTVTRIESDCTFRIGFSSLMNRTFFRRSLSLEKYVQEEDDLWRDQARLSVGSVYNDCLHGFDNVIVDLC